MSVSKRRRRREWAELVTIYDSSDQTLRAFCTAQGINPHTFQYWRRKLKKESTPAFVEFRPQASPAGLIRLRKGEVEVELPGNYPGTQLAALLNHLSC
jgi:transposase-like protein